MTAPDRVDRRAERVRAQGDLELARAEAEAVRAETAARVAVAEEDAQARQAARKAALRDERRRRRQARGAELTARVSHLTTRLPNLAGAAACVAPTVLAMRGQYAFARDEMRLRELSFLAPTMLEGAAWMLVAVRHQAARQGHRTWLLAVGVWALALVGAALNYWHGLSSASAQVGAMYAAASLVGFGLVELLEWRRRAAIRSGRTPKVGLLRAARFPLVAWSAWSRQVELGPDGDPAEAWRQAWLDRYDVEPGADRAARKAGRLRVGSEDYKRARHGVHQVPDAGRAETAVTGARAAVSISRPARQALRARRVPAPRRVVPSASRQPDVTTGMTLAEQVAYFVEVKKYGRPRIVRETGEKSHVIQKLMAEHRAREEAAG